MNTKETKYNWGEIAYKVDPELSSPVVTYEFDNGNRVFYKEKKRNKKNIVCRFIIVSPMIEI